MTGSGGRAGRTAGSREDRALLRRVWWRSVAQTAAGMTVVLLLAGGVAYALVTQHRSSALDAELTQILVTADDVGDPPPGYYLAHRRDDGSVETTPGTPGAVAVLLVSTVAGSADDPELIRPHDIAVPDVGACRVQLTRRPDGQNWAIANDLAGLRTDQQEVLQAILLAEATGVAGSLAAAALLSRRAVAPLADALRLQRRFVADASHELRAPLTVLHTRAQMLATAPSVDPDSSLGHGLNGLVEDTRALGDVVEDLLVAAELDRHPRRMLAVDVHELATQVCRSMTAHAAAQEVDLSHTHHEGPEDLLVTGHPTALRRAVTALVDNAIAHTPPGGAVVVHTGIRDGRVELVVTDTGIGFDPAAAEALFVRSQHTDRGPRPRFGLGLALVREIAQAHGGTVTADGEPGRGARFTLRLPVRPT